RSRFDSRAPTLDSAMASDLALYVAVDDLDVLRHSLPSGFVELDLLTDCEFARAVDPERGPRDLGSIAETLGRDALVMGYDDDYAESQFWFAHYRAGVPERVLVWHKRQWLVVHGTPEAWESDLPDVPVAGEVVHEDLDPDMVCWNVGKRYRLTGWYRF